MPRREGGAGRLAAAALLGAASVAAFAPLGWFPLAWVTLAGLSLLLDGAAAPGQAGRARRGFLLGWAFGCGLFLAGVSWVYVSLSIFGGMPAPVAALATLLFCLAMALYPGIAGALYLRFAAGCGVWRRAALFAAAWTLTEWCRGWVLTGFPWLAFGYSQTPPSPFAGFAPLFGVYGVSLATAFAAALLAASLRAGNGRARWCCLVALAAIGLTGVLGAKHAWTQPQGEPFSVALLQGNIAQEIKWRPEHFADSLRTYHALMRDNPAQLTVMPESALPALLDQLPPDYLAELTALAARQRGDLLLGVVTRKGGGYANSAVSFGQSGMQVYDKAHLVPFGEFIPPGFGWFMAMADIPMSDFAAGTQPQEPMTLGGRRVALNICYEDAFGEEIIGALPSAQVLVNLSNVAWFGDSLAPAQHLQIARLRALETGRMMLRATNTGMTAIIGAHGEVQGLLAPFTRGALRGDVYAFTGETPYVRWGNVPAAALSLALLALAVPASAGRRKTLS